MLEAVNAGSEIAAGFCNLGVEKGGGCSQKRAGEGMVKAIYISINSPHFRLRSGREMAVMAVISSSIGEMAFLSEEAGLP